MKMVHPRREILVHGVNHGDSIFLKKKFGGGLGRLEGNIRFMISLEFLVVQCKGEGKAFWLEL